MRDTRGKDPSTTSLNLLENSDKGTKMQNDPNECSNISDEDPVLPLASPKIPELEEFPEPSQFRDRYSDGS
jgi:hypothetical protein